MDFHSRELGAAGPHEQYASSIGDEIPATGATFAKTVSLSFARIPR